MYGSQTQYLQSRLHCGLIFSFSLAGLPRNFKLSRLVEILSPTEKDDIKRQIFQQNTPTAAKCRRHQDKDLEYFCESCKALVCGQCMLDEHRTHGNVGYAKEFLAVRLEALGGLITLGNSATANGQRALSSFNADVENVKRQGNENADFVHAYFNRLRQLLGVREKQLVGRVHREVEEKVEAIARRKQVVQESMESIHKCVQSIENIFEVRKGDIKILEEETPLRSMLYSHMEVIETEASHQEQREVPSLSVPAVEDPQFEQLCRTVGEKITYGSFSTPPTPIRSRVFSAQKYRRMSPTLERPRTDSAESSGTEYTDPESRMGDFGDMTDSLSDIHVPPTPPLRREPRHVPPTPPLRRESYKIEAEVYQPVLEIGPKNLSGSLFRSMAEDVSPCGVCSGTDNTIVVTDVRNHNIRILTSTGEWSCFMYSASLIMRSLDMLGLERNDVEEPVYLVPVK